MICSPVDLLFFPLELILKVLIIVTVSITTVVLVVILPRGKLVIAALGILVAVIIWFIPVDMGWFW